MAQFYKNLYSKVFETHNTPKEGGLKEEMERDVVTMIENLET